jgi:hypothetical protein
MIRIFLTLYLLPKKNLISFKLKLSSFNKKESTRDSQTQEIIKEQTSEKNNRRILLDFDRLIARML